MFDVSSLRFTSGAMPANLLMASMAASRITVQRANRATSDGGKALNGTEKAFCIVDNRPSTVQKDFSVPLSAFYRPQTKFGAR